MQLYMYLFLYRYRNRENVMKSERKRQLFDILRIIGLLVAFSVLLYPTISNYLYEKNSSRVISLYDEEIIRRNQEEIDEIMETARQYNRELLKNLDLLDPFSTQKQEVDQRYENTLRLNDAGMMGYIKIPKINVELPIYHGTEEKVLQTGIGHFRGTSFPVGGDSTHAVLTGHRGLPSKMLFTDLDKMKIGDVFYINALGKTMAYEVDQILTVLPEDTKELSIVSGKDYVTLVTCTPYAVNTHRLLVRGHAIPYEESDKPIVEEKQENGLSFQTKMLIYAMVILAIFFVCYIVYILLFKRNSSKYRRGKYEKKKQ